MLNTFTYRCLINRNVSRSYNYLWLTSFTAIVYNFYLYKNAFYINDNCSNVGFTWKQMNSYENNCFTWKIICFTSNYHEVIYIMLNFYFWALYGWSTSKTVKEKENKYELITLIRCLSDAEYLIAQIKFIHFPTIWGTHWT